MVEMMVTQKQPARRLTPMQIRIVGVMCHDSRVSYRSIAAATGIGVRTVRMHVEQLARLLPGNGNPLSRVALYAERLLRLSQLP
jgi:DNA-binding CsgD family transcriptional regulator